MTEKESKSRKHYIINRPYSWLSGKPDLNRGHTFNWIKKLLGSSKEVSLKDFIEKSTQKEQKSIENSALLDFAIELLNMIKVEGESLAEVSGIIENLENEKKRIRLNKATLKEMSRQKTQVREYSTLSQGDDVVDGLNELTSILENESRSKFSTF